MRHLFLGKNEHYGMHAFNQKVLANGTLLRSSGTRFWVLTVSVTPAKMKIIRAASNSDSFLFPHLARGSQSSLCAVR